MKKLVAYFSILVFLSTTPAFAGTMVATWYGNEYHGRKTASGERFNQWAMTAAHRTLPFGTQLEVTHGDETIIVTINDRGPFVKGVHLDLSKGAATKLGCLSKCKVHIRILN